jgi:site-specific DNA recombinase
VEAERLTSLDDEQLVSSHIVRVDVKQGHLAIKLAGPEKQSETQKRHDQDHSEHGHPDTGVLVVPWKKRPLKRTRAIIPAVPTASRQDQRPIRVETRAKLVTAIAKGRHWLSELVAGTVENVERIADREKCSIRQVNRTITLAFLAPSLVQAAVDGRLPRGIGLTTLRDLPAEWARQYERLGLSS